LVAVTCLAADLILTHGVKYVAQTPPYKGMIV
jgi:hypothetical protein